MAPQRLADTRTLTMDDAKAAFADLAQARLRTEKRAAAAEVRIATIKADLAQRNAEDDAAIAAAEARMTAYILANPSKFRKPRQIKTEFGKFGLRDATRVQIIDEEMLLADLAERGMEDCIETRKTVVKDALKKRIADGERFPGAQVQSGDLVTYTVDKALIAEAREEVA